MPVFATAEELYDLLGGFFRSQAGTPEAAQIAQQGLVVQFVYHDPEAVITLGPKGTLGAAAGLPQDPHFLEMAFGAGVAARPELVFEMQADVAHRFWLGQVNLLMALARQQIRAKGPVGRALKLLPTLEKFYPRYAEYLRQRGAADRI